MIWIKKLPRSLWNVKEQLHTTYMYPLPNIISWEYGRQVQSGYYGTIKARPKHAYTVNSR